MNTLDNIKKYNKAFKSESKKKNASFINFLNQNNLTIVDFLINVGLNSELIKGFNYKELEELTSKILNYSSFPKLDILNEEPLCLQTCSEESTGIITIEDNHIIFDFSSANDLEHSQIKNISFTSYYLMNNFIRRMEVDVLMVHQNDMSGYDYNELEFKVKEINCDFEGNVISNKSYYIKINQGVNGVLFSDMLRPLYCGQVEPGLYNFLELIGKGKIKKENVVININHPITQKK